MPLFACSAVLAVLSLAFTPLAEALGHQEGSLLGDPDCSACHLAAATRTAVVPEPATLAWVQRLAPSGILAAVQMQPRTTAVPATTAPRAPPQLPA